MIFLQLILYWFIGVNGQNCGGELIIGNGVISSPPDPSDPSVYASNMNCIWTIGVENSRVEITVAEG